MVNNRKINTEKFLRIFFGEVRRYFEVYSMLTRGFVISLFFHSIEMRTLYCIFYLLLISSIFAKKNYQQQFDLGDPTAGLFGAMGSLLGGLKLQVWGNYCGLNYGDSTYKKGSKSIRDSV